MRIADDVLGPKAIGKLMTQSKVLGLELAPLGLDVAARLHVVGDHLSDDAQDAHVLAQ